MEFPKEEPLSDKVITECVNTAINDFLVPALLEKEEELHQSGFLTTLLTKNRPEFYLHVSDAKAIVKDMMARAVQMSKESIFGRYFHYLVELFVRERFNYFFVPKGIVPAPTVDVVFYDSMLDTLYEVECKSSPVACNKTMVNGIAHNMWRLHNWLLEHGEKTLTSCRYEGVRLHDYGVRKYDADDFPDEQLMSYTVLEGQMALFFCTGQMEAYRLRLMAERAHKRLKKALQLLDSYDCDCESKILSDIEAWNTLVREYVG